MGGHGDFFSVSETSDSTSEQLMTIFSDMVLFSLYLSYFRSISLILMCFDPFLESTYYFFHPINTKLHCVYHHCFAIFSFSGWPPCQWSDMTSVEVSQRAYNLLCIRDIWLFVICMKLMSTWYGICIYFGWINFCVCLSHGWHELNGSRCPLSEKGR